MRHPHSTFAKLLGLGLFTLALGTLTHASDARARSARGRQAKMTITGKVNLNNASVEQLRKLPRMTERTAKAIVAYRAQQRFVTIRDVTKVKGIGEKSFLRLKPYLTVEGPTTIQRQPAATSRSRSKPSQPAPDRSAARAD